MFKEETFSEILDKKIKKEEALKVKQIARKITIKEEKQKRIIDLVHLQYEFAQETIGKRFTIKQQHDTMFYFNFRGKHKSYCCKIYSYKLDPEGDFEFNDYSFSYIKNSKLDNIAKTIKLNELGNNLIDWAGLVLKEELEIK